jgi:hypothetical protein
MADELYETDARALKAWKRVLAAVRKLGKSVGDTETVEAVANAGHADPSTREMRRYEALATLLEALAADEPEKPGKPQKRESE